MESRWLRQKGKREKGEISLELNLFNINTAGVSTGEKRKYFGRLRTEGILTASAGSAVAIAGFTMLECEGIQDLMDDKLSQR